MTPHSRDLADLLAALRKVESSNSGGGPLDVGSVTTNWYRNPEGREAADLIEALLRREPSVEEVGDTVLSAMLQYADLSREKRREHQHYIVADAVEAVAALWGREPG